MPSRNCVCQTCGRRVEFEEQDPPCEALRGWLMVSHLKGIEAIEQHGFCSLSCLQMWADERAPQVPDIFIESLEEDDF